MNNKVITTQGNVQFQFPDGKLINVHPNHIYTVFNEDTVSFILVGLPKTSGLSTMTSKAEDLELNGTVYSFAELPNAVSEAFAIAGAQARCEIVDELPETGYTNTIYLVPQEAPQTGFDEYVYILNQGWELIGDTSIEMNNYVLKNVFSGYTADTAVIINNEISARTAGDTALDNKINALSASTDEAISGLTDAIDAEETAREAADGVISGAVDTVSSGLAQEVQRAQNAESGLSDAIDAEETRALAAEDALDDKIDAVSAATDAALANKQNTLIAGEHITISSTTSGDVISAEVDSITIDPSLDSGSTNPVANSAITNNTLSGGVETNNSFRSVRLRRNNGEVAFYKRFAAINGNSVMVDGTTEAPNFQLVETSAITTSVTSASTDSEIPSAKAMHNELAAIDAKFIDDAKYELSGSTHVINFYNGDTIKATIDCSDFIIDGMVDNVYIENGYLVIDFNTESGKQDIQIPLTDIFNPNNYYTKSETSGATELSTEFATKLNTADFNTYSGSVDTRLAEDEEVTSRALNALNEAVSGKVSTSDFEVYSGAVETALSGKVNVDDNVVSAHSFNKSTKIYYPDITAERRPSIPSGTKKISIGFTMLPSNNQLFENLQFVTFNPFNIVDVASGLTVGVAEDMSTIPFTYTVTSVTWTGDDSIMTYDLSENDTLLNLYAQGDYQFGSIVPKGINVLSMYIDVLEDIESGQTAEVVNDGVIKNFESIGKYLQYERNRVDDKIDDKLDATAYTPVVSSIMQGSTNPVEGGTLWDELRVQTSSGGGETTIAFDGNNYSTNYPLGCTSLKVNVGAVDEFVSIYFYNASNTNLGEISVANFGGIEVTNNTLPNATYEINGNIVTLSYPSQGIVKIEKRYSENFSFSAVNPPVYDTLKNVVDGKANSSDVYLKSETSGATEIATALSAKLDATAYTPTDLSNYYTKSETSGATEIATALSEKQDTLIAGENIIISSTTSGDVISAEGGGGKSVEAGRGISVTTGATADTVSFNLPISAGTGTNSIKENYSNNTASGQYSHAEGYNTTATGSYSHAEGRGTTAGTGSYSHAEGYNTKATGSYSHAEGASSLASGQYSHAEGYNTTASGAYSHAEGYYTTASTDYVHAEGYNTKASGTSSHAEGYNTTASGAYSHAEGRFTTTQNESEHTSGQFNVSSSASTTFGDSGNTLFSVGNGTSSSARHNAFEIRQNGDIYCTDGTNDVKLQDTITATAANTTALGGMKIVKLTESEYAALVTKDSNTLYVVIPDPTNP